MNAKGNSEGKSYLLQTAFVIAGNPEDHSKEEKLRLVIDSGFQRSYVTHIARALLELPTTICLLSLFEGGVRSKL